jgi:hypothetical protein
MRFGDLAPVKETLLVLRDMERQDFHTSFTVTTYIYPIFREAWS